METFAGIAGTVHVARYDSASCTLAPERSYTTTNRTENGSRLHKTEIDFIFAIIRFNKLTSSGEKIRKSLKGDFASSLNGLWYITFRMTVVLTYI